MTSLFGSHAAKDASPGMTPFADVFSVPDQILVAHPFSSVSDRGKSTSSAQSPSQLVDVPDLQIFPQFPPAGMTYKTPWVPGSR